MGLRCCADFRFISTEAPTQALNETFERVLHHEEANVDVQGSQLRMFEKP